MMAASMGGQPDTFDIKMLSSLVLAEGTVWSWVLKMLNTNNRAYDQTRDKDEGVSPVTSSSWVLLPICRGRRWNIATQSRVFCLEQASETLHGWHTAQVLMKERTQQHRARKKAMSPHCDHKVIEHHLIYIPQEMHKMSLSIQMWFWKFYSLLSPVSPPSTPSCSSPTTSLLPQVHSPIFPCKLFSLRL